MNLLPRHTGLLAGLLAMTAIGLPGQARAHDIPDFGPAPVARLLQPVHYRHYQPPPRWLRHYYRHHHRPWWRHDYYDRYMLRRHYRHMKRRHYHHHRAEPHGSYLYFEYRF